VPEDITIKEGACISSIAFERGMLPQTIWNHSPNAALKSERKDMNLLAEGDTIHVPDLVPKEVSVTSEERHRYRRKGVPTIFRIKVLEEGEPLSDLPYRIEIDGKGHEGESDPDGIIEHWIPSNATRATLFLGPPEEEEEIEIKVGNLEPVTTVKGVQQRLNNLGFDAGEITNEMNDDTTQALKMFQAEMGREDPDGALDNETREALESSHDLR
jgi:N-acetylmuramoyl-L-alanine amidase